MSKTILVTPGDGVGPDGMVQAIRVNDGRKANRAKAEPRRTAVSL